MEGEYLFAVLHFCFALIEWIRLDYKVKDNLFCESYETFFSDKTSFDFDDEAIVDEDMISSIHFDSDKATSNDIDSSVSSFEDYQDLAVALSDYGTIIAYIPVC